VDPRQETGVVSKARVLLLVSVAANDENLDLSHADYCSLTLLRHAPGVTIGERDGMVDLGAGYRSRRE
jgi:hypothetical protein